MGILAILSGLAAALSWGAGDFSGGVASRRAAPVRVVLASQFIGTLALLALGWLLVQPRPLPADLLTGAIAGLAGGIGLLLLYLSLARGKMGVAAPLTAVAAGGIPLFVGLATEGLPGVAQLAGFLLALAAIWIISRPGGAERIRLGDIGLPLLAGVGFGVFLAIIGRIEAGTGFVWPLVAARAASMTLMGCLLLAGISGGVADDKRTPVRRRQTTGDGRQTIGDEEGDSGRGPSSAVRGRSNFPWHLAAIAGVGDTAGNAFFVYSSQVGRLDAAAVLGALYPAATVLLARMLLGEQLTSRQHVGVGLALLAVILIAL